MQSRCFTNLLVLGCLSFTPMAMGQTLSQVYGDSLTKQAHTIYVKGIASMATFDSEAAGSKETRTVTEQEIGGWMGESRIAGIRVVNQKVGIPFELNNAKSELAFTDVRLTGRIWFLQPSIGMSLSEIDVSRAGQKTIGLFATGINAGLGLIVNLHTGLVFSADMMKVQQTRTFDKLDLQTKEGNREDLDANFAFDLTERVVDFIVGYKMRSYTLSSNDVSYKESSQGAYAGLRLGYYF